MSCRCNADRLTTASPAPACYQDVQWALRYVHQQAALYHLDPARVYLIGMSAGGHMVSLAATAGDNGYKRTGGWEGASNSIAGKRPQPSRQMSGEMFTAYVVRPCHHTAGPELVLCATLLLSSPAHRPFS